MMMSGLRCIVVIGAALISLFAANGPPHRVTRAPQGTLLVVDQQGERSGQVQIGAGHDEILAVQGAAIRRVVARGLTVPCCGFGGLAASPQGRYVAFSQEATAHPGPAGQTEGLWLMTSSGARLHRLLLPPPPPHLGVTFAIGPVAWAPNGPTLAYAVNSSATARDTRGLGIWLTRYDRPQPRLAVTLPALYRPLPPPRGPFRAYGLFITALSWAPDRRTLVVSLQYPVATSDGFSTAVVAADLVTGRTRAVVTACGTAGGDAAVAARTGQIAYVTGSPTGTTLWIADARGQRAHALTAARQPHRQISSPAWSPDGYTIAYLVGGVAQHDTTLQTLDVATGRHHIVLRATQPGLPLRGYFERVTWMPARP